MFSTIIFDLDGTLLYSIEDLWLSTNHALRQMGYAERSLKEVTHMVGNGVGRLIRQAVPEGTCEADFERTFELFKAHYVVHCQDHTRPYPGVLDVLTELRQRGVRTAIVSNKFQAGVDELYERWFKGLIDVAIGEREGLRRKPAPDMPREALRLLGVDTALYVGDSEVDVATARAAHLPLAACTWGYRSAAALREAGATWLIDRPEELLST